ncbi:MAG: polyribonucleotide nucleotidyltransferase [Clostridia bacterium]
MATHMNFDNVKTFETTLAGRPLIIETGKIAGLANGSCTVRYGDTYVLVTATASQKPRDGIDFFPLSIDFEERMYAVGRIPGSFNRREGRAGERATLASRLIDRPMRPLFPSDMRNDVAIMVTVMSTDYDNAPEIAGMIGACVSVAISDIPFPKNMAGVNVGLIDGKPVINPTSAEREVSQMLVTVAGTAEKIVMIEAAADQVPDDLMYESIVFAHQEVKKLVAFIDDIQAQIGKEKFSYESHELNQEFYALVKDFAYEDIKLALDTDDKTVRDARMKVIEDKIAETYPEAYEENKGIMGELFYKLQKSIVRAWLLEGKRVDGRGMEEVRPLAAEVGIVPRMHGTGLFTRGQTQVLSIATLGTLSDAQKLDTIYEEDAKRYMHHYNFPPYSVGESRPVRGPGRREIGHGALAEKALEAVIPDVADFPYAIRVVSEIVSSNGSTSQGSICGSTLALMDAGVPLKAPVAGISCGLITEENGEFTTFTDIQGIEDFYGDMDFKVGGTHTGVTAIQVDIKTDGLSNEVIKQAFDKCLKARLMILDEIMLPVIAEPRAELSPYAPKMFSMKIHPDKIREVIGKGGSVIQGITAESGAKVEIDEDGNIVISAVNGAACEVAKKMIEDIVREPEVGMTYDATVMKIIEIGAFVEFMPGRQGMVHISNLADYRVAKVDDVVSVGDKVRVKLMKIDDKGRLNLSMKDAE